MIIILKTLVTWRNLKVIFDNISSEDYRKSNKGMVIEKFLERYFPTYEQDLDLLFMTVVRIRKRSAFN